MVGNERSRKNFTNWGGIGMALTELEVKNSKPTKKAFRLPDGKGLYLDIRPTGRD
jgi:hypothetical protein